MKNKVLAGAVLMLALALTLNAVAILLNRSSSTGSTFATPAAANVGGDGLPGIFYLGRDTYFITSSTEGNSVFLWYYDYSPNREDNRLIAIDQLSVSK